MGTTDVAINRCSDGGDVTKLENGFLAAAAAVAAVTPFLPLIVWLLTKSVDAVKRCISEYSVWAAVLNSILWVVFTVSAKEKIDNIELIVAYPVILTCAYVSMIIVYGSDGRIIEAVVLTTMVVLCLVFTFIALRFPIETPPLWHKFLGICGLVTFLSTHICIILDLQEAISRAGVGVALLNVLPNTAVNAGSLYFYLKNGRDNVFVLGSCGIGSVLGVGELMAMIMFAAKKNWYRGAAPAADNGDGPGNHGIIQHIGARVHGLANFAGASAGISRVVAALQQRNPQVFPRDHLPRYHNDPRTSPPNANAAGDDDDDDEMKGSTGSMEEQGKQATESSETLLNSPPASAENEESTDEITEDLGKEATNGSPPTHGKAAGTHAKTLLNNLPPGVSSVGRPIPGCDEINATEDQQEGNTLKKSPPVAAQGNAPLNGPPPPYANAAGTDDGMPNLDSNGAGKKGTTESTKDQGKKDANGNRLKKSPRVAEAVRTFCTPKSLFWNRTKNANAVAKGAKDKSLFPMHTVPVGTTVH